MGDDEELDTTGEMRKERGRSIRQGGWGSETKLVSTSYGGSESVLTSAFATTGVGEVLAGGCKHASLARSTYEHKLHSREKQHLLRDLVHL